MTKYRTQEERDAAYKEQVRIGAAKYRNNPANREKINFFKRRWYHKQKLEKQSAKQAKLEELKKLSLKIRA